MVENEKEFNDNEIFIPLSLQNFIKHPLYWDFV